jgi:arsenate reductase
VLFACVHNIGRSQMAAAIFNSEAHPAKVRAISAGAEPGIAVDPVVVQAMLEIEIDLSQHVPTLLTAKLSMNVTYLVTMGCGRVCPLIPDPRREDWPLDDPVGRPLALVRLVRDDVQARVRKLLRERGWGRDR